MSLIKCECAKGTGYKVEITYPGSPDSGKTPCCSCTVERYEALYGKASFIVTPVTSIP